MFLTAGINNLFWKAYNFLVDLNVIESSWNVMAHGDAREGKWRGNCRMKCVASTLHNISEHGVSSITTADTHNSAVSSRLKWGPPPISMDSSVSPKDEIWLMRVCHHISNAAYIHSANWFLWALKSAFKIHTNYDFLVIRKATNFSGKTLHHRFR